MVIVCVLAGARARIQRRKLAPFPFVQTLAFAFPFLISAWYHVQFLLCFFIYYYYLPPPTPLHLLLYLAPISSAISPMHIWRCTQLMVRCAQQCPPIVLFVCVCVCGTAPLSCSAKIAFLVDTSATVDGAGKISDAVGWWMGRPMHSMHLLSLASLIKMVSCIVHDIDAFIDRCKWIMLPIFPGVTLHKENLYRMLRLHKCHFISFLLLCNFPVVEWHHRDIDLYYV